MTQVNNIVLLAQAIGGDIGIILGRLGNLSALTTTEKGSLVGALNELKAALGAQINDTTASTSTVYSSSKTTAVANAAAAAAAAGLINDSAASGTKTYSSTKINAVAAAAGNSAAAALISDTSPSASKTYSSAKIEARINAAIAAIIDGAPEAFDTLKELADYVASDQSAVAAMTASINNRVRFDAAQTLTAVQQKTACTNIGIGDPETDFAAAYVTAKG